MTNQASIAALLDLIRDRQSFVITSHTRPDGDAIGSSLGFLHFLEALGKQASVVFVDSIPTTFQSLPGVERITGSLPTLSPDAAIFLECDSIDRSSLDRHAFDAYPPALTLNIDHHSSGRNFAGFNWIDPEAAAVGTMVYDLVLASGVIISPDMATCLYAAVLTDTGSFTHPGTSAATFALAGHLVECGADPSHIAQDIFFSNPTGKIRLLGTALSKMELEQPFMDEPGGHIAWSAITLADMERAGAGVEDCEGVVNFLISMASVESAAFLRELPSGNHFRLSLRSKGDLDVAAVAEAFGGGGHRNASGCTLEGSLPEVSARIVAHLRAATARLHTGSPAGASTLLA